MQHTSCNALGRVGPLFSGTGVPLGLSTGKDGPNRPRVEGEREGRGPENCGAPHGRYPLLLDTRLWYPRAPTHSRPLRRRGRSCVGRCLYIEPVPSLRRGWRPALAPPRSSGRLAPPLGLRRSVPSVRGGRDNPTRLRRATRSPLLLGPEQARVSAWGLRPSVLGTVGARLRVGEVEADGAFSSARCARLGARTTSAKPLASGLPAAAAPRARSPPQPLRSREAPRSGEAAPLPPAARAPFVLGRGTPRRRGLSEAV